MNKQRGFSLIELLLVLAIVAIIGVVLLGGGFSTSTGTRTGVIQKLSYRGAICKTWDGEMALTGFKRTGQSTSNTWEFTVADAKLLDEIQRLSESQTTVTLQYDERWRMPCSGSRYQITGIKVVPTPTPTPVTQEGQ